MCALCEPVATRSSWEKNYEIPLKERSLRTESESGEAQARPKSQIIDIEFGPGMCQIQRKIDAVFHKNWKKLQLIPKHQ